MKNVLWKDIFRDIKRTKGKFISIASIIALGVMLFSGVKIAPINMKATADKYYDDYNLMDLRVLSTLGLTDEDVNDIKNIEGVLGVEPSKTLDAISRIDSNDFVIRVHSLSNDNLNEDNEDYINRLNLIEGRLPSNSGECVVGKESFESLNLKIGDKIKLNSGNESDINDSLTTNEYEVVGIVKTPYYLSNQIGNSSIGNGTVKTYMFINEFDFKSEIYTDIYVTVKDAKALDSYDEKYFDVTDKVKESIESISNLIIDRRYNELINEANVELNKGKDEYEAKKSEAEEKILEIQKPGFYVLDRKSHYSYVDYENSANSIDKLSNVFPVFFFVVAALVCLTTMTRMVDEQRVNIGTLKALGYSKGSIAKKFIVYALFASLIGCVLGVALGLTALPSIIFNAYSIMYILPKMTFVINIPLIIAIFVISIGVTTLATYAACRIELIEVPSILMRPKAPKEGKRILLERIPFIWNRFNFTSKVTIRNIFRYKKRFMMTVIGIAGSTALLLTGFGIKDSIKTVVSKQYGELTQYDVSINLNETINSDEKNILEEYLKQDSKADDFIFIRSESGETLANEISKNVNIIVTDEDKKFDEFQHLQDRKSKETVILPKNGIVISEKLAKLLNVKVGDEIELINNNDNKAQAKIGAIVEHYINHYVYIDADYYKELFNNVPEENSIFVKVNNEDYISEISNNLINMNGVSGVVSNISIKDNFDNTIKSLDLVVLVMIFCAGALSFIVLYNLTNVNISERIREIATIKVLGFYDNEVSSYIFRENILLTVIGAIVGLFLGVVFHKFIMVTVEMEYIMFGRTIDFKSFIMAAILTIIFSLLVNWAMYYKLKKVEMVESLKSVD
ncbi:MAG: FtsX-like permease family protein [Clostridium celatum]|nr:FtsX-like permease family protein [Clostridium celatum]MDU4978896.1 FtsX-like permease family protein [Clostridium celatum]